MEQNGQKLTFVKRFVSKEEYERITCNEHKGRSSRDGGNGNKKLDITLIGKFTINRFNEKDIPQIEIVEIETEISKGRRLRRL